MNNKPIKLIAMALTITFLSQNLLSNLARGHTKEETILTAVGIDGLLGSGQKHTPGVCAGSLRPMAVGERISTNGPPAEEVFFKSLANLTAKPTKTMVKKVRRTFESLSPLKEALSSLDAIIEIVLYGVTANSNLENQLNESINHLNDFLVPRGYIVSYALYKPNCINFIFYRIVDELSCYLVKGRPDSVFVAEKLWEPSFEHVPVVQYGFCALGSRYATIIRDAILKEATKRNLDASELMIVMGAHELEHREGGDEFAAHLVEIAIGAPSIVWWSLEGLEGKDEIKATPEYWREVAAIGAYKWSDSAKLKQQTAREIYNRVFKRKIRIEIARDNKEGTFHKRTHLRDINSCI